MASVSLAEKLEKIRDPNLESQRQTRVVLAAIDETLKEQKTEPTATGYFAVLLSLLGHASAGESVAEDKAISLVYLLDLVAPFVPQALLRAKFTTIFTHLAPALAHQDAPAPLLRPSIGCLETLLLAQDSASWTLTVVQIGPRRAVAGLLNLAMEPRPKIRKRAQDALRNVLKSPPPSPSLDHPAADMCAETAMQSLADKVALARKDKKSAQAAHDPDLIHALQLTRTIASACGGWPSKKIEPLCELLLGIARSGSDHLTMAVFDVFEMIFEGMADEVARAKLPRLLEIISELHPSANDTQLLPPWIAILSRAYDVSAQMEPMETFQGLPDIFASIAEYLDSPSENIRTSASECLISFLANCIPSEVLLEPSIFDEKALERLGKTVEGLLSVKYQAAWPQTFSVLGAMLDALRWRADPLLIGVVKVVGELRASDAFLGKKEADEILGKAIRAMGPATVLGALPLNLAKPSKTEPGRVWLLPLLRDYTANTNLAHFRSELVPLSELMFAKVLENGTAEKTMTVKIYETVVQQIWSVLPGYCDLPLDLLESFDETFAQQLSNLLYHQVDLRLDICRALRCLVESNQAVTSIEGPEDLVLQSRVSKAQAQKNLDFLGTFANNFLAVLFNVYSQTLPQTRGPILQTINAFLSVTPAKDLGETFDRLCKALAAAFEEAVAKPAAPKGQRAADQLPSSTHSLMDLVVTMSIYLPRENFTELFNIASLVILKDDDPQLQKKAYKLIPRLAESDIGKQALVARHQELQTLLLTSAEKVSAPARRERLAAISALLPYIPNNSLHFIPSILPEVIVACKEHNERARNAAFELLVLMGQRMSAEKGVAIDNNKVPHMPEGAPAATASIEEYFTMLGAGLASHTPHVMSASVTAITRVLFEFHEEVAADTLEDVVKTVELFLTSNNRELVKSIMGFVKVCITGLPVEMMKPRLASLVPCIMTASHEHKGHFRSRVKHLLERLVRRFGFDEINKHCPEADRKLINGIRKSKERSKKRKEAAKENGEADAGDHQTKRRNQFESEYDHALFDSDEDDSASSDDSDDEMAGTKSGRANRNKGGKAYIVEDEDEPLDLLGQSALAKISSTKPMRMRKATKTKAKVDMDGKLILGRDDDGDDRMEVEDPAEVGEGGGVGAYVAALKGKDVPKKTLRGKLKWSNKRSKDEDDDDDDDLPDGDAAAAAAAVKGRKASFGSGRGRGGGRSGGRGAAARGRAGKGGIASGRRGLGEGKQRGPPGHGGVAKSPRGRGRR
ncbi:hypothetical protein RB594_007712 [Gaeumannomyces avenae]